MKPIRVLFVCHGNICRSVMAEYMFKDKIDKLGLSYAFEIDSCATSREEIGNTIYPPARTLLQRYGIPCGNHRARQITQKDYDYFDYIIAMDNNNLRNLARMIEDKDHKISKLLDRDVADPWYTDDFEATYQDIQKGMTLFLNRLTQEGLL